MSLSDIAPDRLTLAQAQELPPLDRLIHELDMFGLAYATQWKIKGYDKQTALDNLLAALPLPPSAYAVQLIAEGFEEGWRDDYDEEETPDYKPNPR